MLDQKILVLSNQQLHSSDIENKKKQQVLVFEELEPEKEPFFLMNDFGDWSIIQHCWG